MKKTTNLIFVLNLLAVHVFRVQDVLARLRTIYIQVPAGVVNKPICQSSAPASKLYFSQQQQEKNQTINHGAKRTWYFNLSIGDMNFFP